MAGEGGWGGGSWGGSPWGGSLDTTTTADSVAVNEVVSISESATVDLPFEVGSATPLMPYAVKVDFTSAYDPVYAPNLDPANYSIPGLSVIAAVPHPSIPQAILLITSAQLGVLYTLTVSTSVLSLSGDPMDPTANTASFLGFPASPTFSAQAQSRTKVRVTFITDMTLDAEYIDPANYSIVHIDGTSVGITSITPIGSDGRRAEIITSGNLNPLGYYALSVSPNVTSIDSQSLSPDTNLFQWREHIPSPIEVPFHNFSGEVSGGLHGTPAGQVFFSPAYETAVANSVIQVEEVNVCTRAFDVYDIPDLPDPAVLYTYASPSSAAAGSFIGAGGPVLFAPAPRLGLARVIVHDLRTDTVTSPVDGPADATLVETIDITRAAFLNDDRWGTFPGASLGVFITADSQTPIGAGPTTSINLQP